MTKQEFIDILKSKESRMRSCFLSEGNENHWRWYEPTIDGLQPSINISVDGKVIFKYAGSLYDNTPVRKEEFSYEDFLEFFSRKMGTVESFTIKKSPSL